MVGFQGVWELIFILTHLVHCLVSPSLGSHSFVLATGLCWESLPSPGSESSCVYSCAETLGDRIPGGPQQGAQKGHAHRDVFCGRGEAGLDNLESRTLPPGSQKP